MSYSGRRAIFGVFLGSLLIQLAWITALPPFRGLDEFDHAYKADAVALGDWSAAHALPQKSRGALVLARESTVEAAGPVCKYFRYTGPENCNPVDHVEQGTVTVASGAANYQPVFYWLIGTPALLLEGSAALLVMRLMAAILSSLMLALAMFLVSLWARTIWPGVALLVASTPVLMYSTAVAAPNGLEMVAGAATWCGFLGLSQRPGEMQLHRRLILWTILPAVVLVSLRMLGPLWLGLIVLSVAMLIGRQRVLELVRNHRAILALATAIVGIACLGNVLWSVASGGLDQGEPNNEYSSPILLALAQVPLWLLQSIAAFPARNEQAPTLVYAIYGIIGLVGLFIGLRLAARRLRAVTGLAIVVSLGVPLAITLATMDTAGRAWQGRYTLPFAVGVLLLLGLALERKSPHHRMIWPGLVCLWLFGSLAHVVSIVDVFQQELVEPAMTQDPLWPVLPSPAIALVALTGLALWGISLTRAHERTPETRHRVSAFSTS